MNKLVLGLLSTILSVVCWIVFWWISIIAIVLGVVGLILKPAVNDTNQGAIVASKVLCIVGIIVAAIALVIMLIALI